MSDNINSFFMNNSSSKISLDEEQFILNNIKKLLKNLITKSMKDGFTYLYKDNFTGRFEQLTEPSKIADDLLSSIIWQVNSQISLFFGEDLNIFSFGKEASNNSELLTVRPTRNAIFHMANIYLFSVFVFERKLLQKHRDKRIITAEYLNILG
ncbi:hypothetical protein A7M79_00095 [Acinetobacter baumannii]|uniref:hypothetical protein n=1 Tax=Acinetobacter baumannii TaxID=470 RepID=UPI0008DD04C9|nr:hypothetical protein [Acinetobacter baumannii]OIH11923.1 hypothetical protein A7M79_00095 [Acinetobacter baumannii]